MIVLLCTIIVVSASDLPAQSISRDPNTILILWGTRHGNRHPEKFLDENPRTWGYEGSTELTSFGKRQGYGLGLELRRFIGNLVDTNYNRSEVKYYSSSANRCQMTLQTALAALHRPSDYGIWNDAVAWSPVPYAINDPMLRMYAVENCPNSDKSWQPISDDTLPNLVDIKREKANLLAYCQENTGWNMSNLGYMADLADNLIEIDLYGTKYPNWISNPTLPGYNFDRMKKEIMEFAEIHQIGCADYEPCRDMMSVFWLQNIIDSLKSASNGTNGGLPRVIGYAGHTETTLSLMKLMGIVRDELTTSAGFVIEFRLLPIPSVRLLNHDPNPIESMDLDHVIYNATYVDQLRQISDRSGFIPLNDFIAHIQSKASSNWQKACGRKDCTANGFGSQNIFVAVSIISVKLLLN